MPRHTIISAPFPLGWDSSTNPLSGTARALEIEPSLTETHHNLGMVLLSMPGRRDEAVACFQRALEIDPRLAITRYQIARALAAGGRAAEAVAQLDAALSIRPDWPAAQACLAWLLATDRAASLRNGARAVELASRADELVRGANVNVLMALAAAYAETGRFAEAEATARRALAICKPASEDSQGNPPVDKLHAALQSHIESYKTHHPLREYTLPPSFMAN